MGRYHSGVEEKKSRPPKHRLGCTVEEQRRRKAISKMADMQYARGLFDAGLSIVKVAKMCKIPPTTALRWKKRN